MYGQRHRSGLSWIANIKRETQNDSGSSAGESGDSALFFMREEHHTLSGKSLDGKII